MMQEILMDPLKRWFLIALVILTLLGVVGLVMMWRNAIKNCGAHADS